MIPVSVRARDLEAEARSATARLMLDRSEVHLVVLREHGRRRGQLSELGGRGLAEPGGVGGCQGGHLAAARAGGAALEASSAEPSTPISASSQTAPSCESTGCCPR
jgi:hypothetical protein